MNIGARTAAWAKSDGWKNPYVTNGLIAMWDGEWNAGGGKHDPTSPILDLSGNGYDLTLTGTDERGDDYFALDGNGFYEANNHQKITEAYDAGILTIEIVAASDGVASAPALVSAFGNMRTGFSISPSFRKISDTNYRYGIGSYVGSNSHITKEIYNNPEPQNGRTARYCLRIGETKIGVDIDGESASSSKWDIGARVNDIFALGARSDRGFSVPENLFYGKYMCCRIYNCELTEAEIAANYAIDKARFGLT